MPDRVVALQLLSSCWLAVILPPLPAALCFSAIYNNEHFSLTPLHTYQGRKFGGYRIIPKACKLSSSSSDNAKESNTGVCMFNYECARKDGTVIGTCVDGFLYGACCKLPAGVYPTTLIDYQDGPPPKTTKKPISTTTTPTTTASSVSSNSWSANKPPQLHHPPAETYLLYENGSAVQNTYSGDDFLHLVKPQYHKQPFDSLTSASSGASSGSNNNYYHRQPVNVVQKNDTVISISHIPSNINPNHIFDMALSLTTKAPSTLLDVANTNKDRSSTSFSSSRPYGNGIGVSATTISTTTTTDRFDNDNYYKLNHTSTYGHTTAKSTQPLTGTIFNKNTYTSSKFGYNTPSTGYTNKYSVYYNNGVTSISSNISHAENEENLVRVPTLSADSGHNKLNASGNGPSNESISHILWLLNQTKLTNNGPATESTVVTRPTQSLYTWLSVDGGLEKTSSYKPFTNNYMNSDNYNNYNNNYNDNNNNNNVHQDATKYSTLLPSTTIHHIPGPSFHVTPEVKITPKPQPNVAESVPTVIVLTPAHELVSSPLVTQKKPPLPIYSVSTTSAPYNVSYHYPQQPVSVSSVYGATHKHPSTKKPILQSSKPSPPSYWTTTDDDKLFQQSTYNTVRPISAGYISKPIYQDAPGITVTPGDLSVYTSSVSSSKPPFANNVNAHLTSTANNGNVPSSVTQTTVVTTAKPITNSAVVSSSFISQNYRPNTRPPSGTVSSSSNFISIKPSGSVYNKFGGSATAVTTSTTTTTTTTTGSSVGGNSNSGNSVTTNVITNKPFHEDSTTLTTDDEYPTYLGPYNGGFNSTEDLIAFPPVRNPYANLTATQHEKPLLTATTTFDGDEEEIESEVTPQFVVDKTLEDKVHVFVEKIVQSLQGNFEDLEKVLLSGQPTNNVTITNGSSPVKKPPASLKPTKKPTATGSITEKPISNRPPLKTTVTTTVSSLSPAIAIATTATTTVASPTILSVTKKPPTKKPSLASPVILFQPSSGGGGTTSKIKIPVSTTTVHIPNAGSGQYITTSVYESASASSAETTEEDKITTMKSTIGQDLKKECGIRPLAKKNARIVGGKGATFGEWPWQVLVREATWLGLFTKNKCGGVLITNRHVITAAHCQPGFLANLVAVFGEYDISGEVESKRSVNKNVKRVIVHRQYDAATFENDIALLELESPVQFDSHIIPICMPEDEDDFTGRMATVTGWGRLKYSGGIPSILQEVQVPVMENRVCQEMFQTAGHPKIILNSFLCAGYANGQRDSCEGDSGGPLMIEKEDGRWVLIATVSHGIKCAAPYLPGVYMRTAYYKPWLQTITGMT